MSYEVNKSNSFSSKFCREISDAIIHDEVRFDDVYRTLSADQKAWLKKYVGPLFIQEGLETGRAVTEEVADDFETREERFGNDVSIFLSGMIALNQELGR